MEKKHYIANNFPHNSRKISAPFDKLRVKYFLISSAKIVIFTLLTGFLAFNLFFPLSSNLLSFEAAKTAVLLSPKDLSAHFLLTQEYLKLGNMKMAENELLLADSLSNGPTSNFPARIATQSVAGGPLPTSAVLGSSLSPLKILEKIKNEPKRIEVEINYWEKIIKDKPDYRDAYLQLTVLNYQIYENNKAKVYLKKAKKLDPNFITFSLP